MHHEREKTADRLSGLGWIVFGSIIIVHALMMETRDYLGATFLTGPGLVPALIGGAIVILGGVLVLRSMRGRVIPFFEVVETGGVWRVALALMLMLAYGIVLIGRIPFGIATFLFVTAFVFVFNLPTPLGRALVLLAAKAGLTGAATAIMVTFIFETIFLVRLP